MPRNRKKVTKNINIEQVQEAKIRKYFGKDINFSFITRQLMKLGLTMLDRQILQDFSDKSIEKFIFQYLDRKSRRLERFKVAEYQDVFEQLVKLGRYYVFEVVNFPQILIEIAEFFREINFETIQKSPVYDEVLKNIAKRSGMIDSAELNKKDNIFIQFTGHNPYTLLWYTKIVMCILSASEKHWEIINSIPEELIPSENLNLIRLNLKIGTSMAKSLDLIREKFANIKIKIKDPDNSGIWNTLNQPVNFIIDKTSINFMGGNRDGVPFQQYIDEINAIETNPIQQSFLILEMYRKIHLISHLSISKNRLLFVPLHSLIIEMIENTFNYLKIDFSLEEQGSNVLLLINF